MPDLEAATLLRAIRARLNVTQEQLAERLGVSFATVNRWEGGGRKPQRAAMLAIIALAREAGVDGTDNDEAAAAVVARRTRGRRGTAAPSTKPMEQMLWDAACSIRGEKDAAKFKDYLLPLLFLKRLSDVFDDEVNRLAEDYGDRAIALQIAEADHSLLRFYLPAEARWAVINGRESLDWPPKERPRDIGEHLTKAVRAVVKHNPSLSGVIDVVDFAAERSGERDVNPAKLRDVVETFSDPRYRLGLADVQPDFLGRAYEYLLRKFAEGSGQSAGEFFTPTEVGFLMAWILRPRPGQECHDYACGSAGLLIKLQIVARELDPTSKVPLKLSGQELQAESYAIARMNAIIHDMDVDLQRGDTMINPKFRTADGRIRACDLVVANPMWNQPFSQEIFASDPFDRFRTAGGITTGKGDWAWLQHTLACMNDHGRAAVVLDTGAVTRGSGSRNEDKERNIRKWFVEQDLIEGVVLLPDNLFYNTTAAGIIVVLNKRKAEARKGKIVLLNASRHFKKGRPKNYLPEEDLRTLAEMFNKGEPVEGEVTVITREQAEEADYNLSPSKWVGSGDDAEHRPLPELLAELSELDKESAAISTALQRLLHGVATADA
jgi:type I restriction enzyme M protein